MGLEAGDKLVRRARRSRRPGRGLGVVRLYRYRDGRAAGELTHTEVTEDDLRDTMKIGSRSGADNLNISSVTFVTLV